VAKEAVEQKIDDVMVKGAVKPGRQLLLMHNSCPSVHTVVPHTHRRLPSPMSMGRRHAAALTLPSRSRSRRRELLAGQ